MTEQEKYADKIAKLLAKAEATTSDAEAETFIGKAQELMTRYQISEDMISPAKEREEIIERTVAYTGTHYHFPKSSLASAIGRVNDCRILQTRVSQSETRIHYIGYESDVERAIHLDSFIQIQMASAMKKWWKENKAQYEWESAYRKMIYRRDFMAGFVSSVSRRLNEAKRRGQEQATQDHAEQTHTTDEEAADSVALVIRDKTAQVNDWVDQTYGRLRYSRGYSPGYGSARNSGSAAGNSADIGNPRISQPRGLPA